MTSRPAAADRPRVLVVQDVPLSARQQKQFLETEAQKRALDVDVRIVDLRTPAERLVREQLQGDAPIDWLVVDSPPRMDEWGWAGLQLCDEVIVPVQAEFFAMHGLSQMLSSLEMAATRLPGKAHLRGILATMVGLAEPVAAEILEDLRKNLGDRVLDTVIVRDAMVVEAASHGHTVFSHSPWSMSALCYAELVKELIDG